MVNTMNDRVKSAVDAVFKEVEAMTEEEFRAELAKHNPLTEVTLEDFNECNEFFKQGQIAVSKL